MLIFLRAAIRTPLGIVICFLALIQSCGSPQKKFLWDESSPEELQFGNWTTSDYEIHLAQIFESSLDGHDPELDLINLSKRTENYIKHIFNVIHSRNELQLKGMIFPKLYLMNSQKIFYFSTPGGKIVISKEVIKKFVTHEAHLIALLCQMFLQSHYNLYLKGKYIPAKMITFPQLISLYQIPNEQMLKLIEFSYVVLKRANYFPEGVLQWLQIQNQSREVFAALNPEFNQSLSMEIKFKQFLIEQDPLLIESQVVRSSSEDFYFLMNEIRSK